MYRRANVRDYPLQMHVNKHPETKGLATMTRMQIIINNAECRNESNWMIWCINQRDPATLFILFPNATKAIWWSDKSAAAEFSSKQDTLSTFYMQICAITHRYGLVYTAARGKDVEKKKCPCLVFVSISTFDASVTNIPLHPLFHPSPSLSLCLPAPSRVVHFREPVYSKQLCSCFLWL